MKKTRSSELRKADTKTNRRYLIAGLMIAVAAGLYIAIYRHSASVQATVPTTAQTVPASTANQETTSAPDMKQVAFGPTIPNTTDPPSKDPVGMVWIPGGEFSMGAQSPPDMDDVGMKATLDSRPIHRVYVDGFFMDKTDATNAEFEKLVKATGSRTHGVFGGVSLSGTSLGPDSGANEKVYGKKISGQQIFAGSVQAPPQAAELLSTLQEKSPSNASRGKS